MIDLLLLYIHYFNVCLSTFTVTPHVFVFEGLYTAIGVLDKSKLVLSAMALTLWVECASTLVDNPRPRPPELCNVSPAPQRAATQEEHDIFEGLYVTPRNFSSSR